MSRACPLGYLPRQGKVREGSTRIERVRVDEVEKFLLEGETVVFEESVVAGGVIGELARCGGGKGKGEVVDGVAREEVWVVEREERMSTRVGDRWLDTVAAFEYLDRKKEPKKNAQSAMIAAAFARKQGKR
jgi:hypothetical protein